MNETPDAVGGQIALSFSAAVTQPQGANGARAGEFRSDPRTRLQAWQERLAKHFAQLAAGRREADWPVFALEHGLTATERDALMRDVRECAAWGLGHDAVLPWVVYAAEIGYEYSGYEYWQTFALKTPELDKRNFTRISSLFAGFAATYHGAVPDGPWAHWFRHIAWPITHGILPRDLQRQLAALLYDASASFRAETFSSAEALGHHLQARCFDYSSRFRQFAENATLLGQIALALLLQDTADALGGAAGAILHSDTLARIVEDLNRERDASQWLAEARSAARFRLRGLSRIPLRGRAGGSAPTGDVVQVLSQGDDSLARPRFILRETAADRWQVRVQLPNLAHLAAQSARSRDVLMRTDGRVAGANVPILAKGRILRDVDPTISLAVWPAPQTQLLTFDGAPPELNAVLRTRFRIDLGEQLLFSIGSDGQARQLATHVLRAGASYLLLRKVETPNPAAGLRSVQVNCVGIYGLRIDVPREVPETLVDVLAILGLEVAQTLELWPAGLPIAEWTGDGHAVLVAGQPTILGIRSDHHLTSLALAIDGVRQPDVHAVAVPATGVPVFVQMPPLRPGAHRITVAARTKNADENCASPGSGSGRAPSELGGELSCFVREPRTASAGQAGALSFAVLPAAPSLEDVWEDRIEIHVAAPGAASLRGRVVLRGLAGQELFNRQFKVSSPCGTEEWRREFALARKAAEAKYDDAQTCVLEFDAGAVGRGRVTAERDFTPLRWAVRANGRRAVLIDSQGRSDLAVSIIPCAAPSLEKRAESGTALEGIVIGDGGALVVARSGGLEAATVVMPPQRINSFSALSGEAPTVPIPGRESSALTALARTAALWERARLAGSSLADMRRTAAVEALIGSLTGAVAGERWADAEDVLRERGPQVAADIMRRLVSNRPDERGVGVMLGDRVASTADAPILEAERALLGALSPFVRVPSLEALAAYALRLAASPAQARALVEGWEKTDGGPDARERALIDGLLACPVILRAARYFVVATRAHMRARGRDSRELPWGN
jgi:hypothetical protein